MEVAEKIAAYALAHELMSRRAAESSSSTAVDLSELPPLEQRLEDEVISRESLQVRASAVAQRVPGQRLKSRLLENGLMTG